MSNWHRSFIQELKSKWMMCKAYRPPFEGCTEDEMMLLKARQEVSYLPELYRQFMLTFGKQSGGITHGGGLFEYPYVLEFKKDGFPVILTSEEVVLPSDIFVFVTDHDAFAL